MENGVGQRGERDGTYGGERRRNIFVLEEESWIEREENLGPVTRVFDGSAHRALETRPKERPFV